MQRIPAIVVISVCAFTFVHSQPQPADSLSQYLRFEDPPPLSCLYTYFPPFFIQHGIGLKSFIRSKTYRQIRAQFGDLRAVDAIYVRAMQMTNNNTAMALLLATIACFDHKLVGLNVPVFSLYVPLSNESEEEFNRRVQRLPVRLYEDSPENERGDRDKLQHFFGSAFLTFVFESQDAAMRFGEFVEKGEDAFIVGGINDERDLRADRQGQVFGAAVLDNNLRFPSEFLTTPLVNSERNVSLLNDVSLCAGVW